MQIPFIVLSYDNFKKSKKLFSYELNGVHTLPIFTDAARALKFATTMSQTLLEQFGDKRVLSTEICNQPLMALRMFETITAYSPDLMRVVIDPKPLVRDNSEELTDLNSISWVENFQDIDDVLEQLQDWVSTDKELGETNGEPESNVP